MLSRSPSTPVSGSRWSLGRSGSYPLPLLHRSEAQAVKHVLRPVISGIHLLPILGPQPREKERIAPRSSKSARTSKPQHMCKHTKVSSQPFLSHSANQAKDRTLSPTIAPDNSNDIFFLVFVTKISFSLVALSCSKFLRAQGTSSALTWVPMPMDGAELAFCARDERLAQRHVVWICNARVRLLGDRVRVGA